MEECLQNFSCKRALSPGELASWQTCMRKTPGRAREGTVCPSSRIQQAWPVAESPSAQRKDGACVRAGCAASARARSLCLQDAPPAPALARDGGGEPCGSSKVRPPTPSPLEVGLRPCPGRESWTGARAPSRWRVAHVARARPLPRITPSRIRHPAIRTRQESRGAVRVARRPCAHFR